MRRAVAGTEPIARAHGGMPRPRRHGGLRYPRMGTDTARAGTEARDTGCLAATDCPRQSQTKTANLAE